MGRLHVIHTVTTIGSPGVRPRPRSAGQPDPVRLPWRLPVPRASRLAAALAGLVAIGAYLFIALSRLNYPFTLEWLEGNSLVEVHRILAGQPLCPAPTAGYVPDGYPPLYFALSAAAARVLGVSYLPLRLVSLVSSLACLAVLARLVQSLLLLSGFHPSQTVPSGADRAVGERLLACMRAFGGTVAVPGDPGLGLMAEMAPAAHQDAAYDVLRASDQAAIASFRRSATEAVGARRFSAIITDGPGQPFANPPSLSRYYYQCPQPLLAGVPAALFLPVAGAKVRPVYVWLPRDGGSCASAVSILDGTAKESRP